MLVLMLFDARLLEFWLSVVAEPVALQQTVCHESEAHIFSVWLPLHNYK